MIRRWGGDRPALAGEGREIRVAATLAQGRAALGEEEYALVLLDLNLPDGNGLDFLTALRRTSGVPGADSHRQRPGE